MIKDKTVENTEEENERENKEQTKDKMTMKQEYGGKKGREGDEDKRNKIVMWFPFLYFSGNRHSTQTDFFLMTRVCRHYAAAAAASSFSTGLTRVKWLIETVESYVMPSLLLMVRRTDRQTE